MTARPATAFARWVAASALVLLALSSAAFWPGYLAVIAAAPRHTHVHAALGTSWLILLIVQPLLSEKADRSWHRKIGWAGLFVGAAFVVSGILIAHRSIARLNDAQFASEGRYVYLPLAMSAIFAAALVLAMKWRHNPIIHGRFMAATALSLLDPLFARLIFFYAPPLPMEWLHQIPAFSLTLGLLVIMFRSLPGESRGRADFRNFAIGVMIVLSGFFFVPPLGYWRAFAEWFRALSLT